MNKSLLIALLLAITFITFGTTQPTSAQRNNDSIVYQDSAKTFGVYEFLEKNSMYVVLLILLIIWIGIFAYLFNIDRKIKKLESK